MSSETAAGLVSLTTNRCCQTNLALNISTAETCTELPFGFRVCEQAP